MSPNTFAPRYEAPNETSSVSWSALDRPPSWLKARDWHWLDRKDVRLIVIHTTECSETTGSAAAVAKFFTTPRKNAGSAHIVVDASEIWECVKPQHEAFGARGGDANATGYHIEHCGYAAQTPVQWDDAFSRGELALSARAAACVAGRYGIPVRKLTPLQVANGERGFCGHLDVSRAWNVRGGHVDPGVGFPWSSYLAAVQAVLPVTGAPRGP